MFFSQAVVDNLMEARAADMEVAHRAGLSQCRQDGRQAAVNHTAVVAGQADGQVRIGSDT